MELALLLGCDTNGTGCDTSNVTNASAITTASTCATVPSILQLLLCCFNGGSSSSSSNINSSSSKQAQPSSSSSSAKTTTTSSKNKVMITDDSLTITLVNSLFKHVNKETLTRFVRTFLLEASASSIRWTLHSLVYNLFKNSSQSQNQDQLYDILIKLWFDAMTLYVDLIGYIVIKSSQSQNTSGSGVYENARFRDFLKSLIDLYKQQNYLIATHANSTIYTTLYTILGELEGLYLEANPCFICSNMEQPLISVKLNAIKSDARFTTNQQIFKLTSSYSIQKLLVKIGDIRKSKMISLINVYYSNRSAQSVVDLKMNSKLWSRAKCVHVQPNQQEIHIEFPLPIVACNLMIEYADFYDRDQQQQLMSTSAESTMLQCPRCSASVPAHPGVCNTCGENVYQCHKCRSINYDERDTYDKIVFDDVRTNAILTAIMVYEASEDPATTSRDKSILPVDPKTGQPAKWPDPVKANRHGGFD